MSSTPDTQLTQVVREWSDVYMRRSMREFKRFMDDSGLSPSQINTMMRLYYGGRCGVSNIGEHLGVTNAAASQMVERMVQLGFFTRSEDASDRRVKQIALTPQGQALIAAGIDARRRWMEELTDSLTPQEQEGIIAALRILTRAAQKLEEPVLDNHPAIS
jgi:DNA-binding MarR family transcriptional regulator